jgi:hypothetical protein
MPKLSSIALDHRAGRSATYVLECNTLTSAAAEQEKRSFFCVLFNI